MELPRGVGLQARAMEEGPCTVGHTVVGTASQRLDGRIHLAPAPQESHQGRHGTVPVVVASAFTTSDKQPREEPAEPAESQLGSPAAGLATVYTCATM